METAPFLGVGCGVPKSTGGIDVDFNLNTKLTVGVQAGGNVGGLGGKYGVYGNLFSVTLIGNENGRVIYPGSLARGSRNLTQVNQSFAAGMFVGGTWSHTQDASFEGEFSVNSKQTYQGFLGNQGTWFGVNYNYDSTTGRSSISIGFNASVALILGFEGVGNLTISW